MDETTDSRGGDSGGAGQPGPGPGGTVPERQEQHERDRAEDEVTSRKLNPDRPRTGEEQGSDPLPGPGRANQAGDGMSDEQFARSVAEQTDPNLKAADVFGREHDGASSGSPVEDVTADDLR